MLSATVGFGWRVPGEAALLRRRKRTGILAVARRTSLVRELRGFMGAMASRNGGSRAEGRFSLKEIAGRAAAEAERQAIRLALQATRGNKSEAARLLWVDYKTLHLKIKQYGIPARRFRGF